jgi:hypothetical protein
MPSSGQAWIGAGLATEEKSRLRGDACFRYMLLSFGATAVMVEMMARTSQKAIRKLAGADADSRTMRSSVCATTSVARRSLYIRNQS